MEVAVLLSRMSFMNLKYISVFYLPIVLEILPIALAAKSLTSLLLSAKALFKPPTRISMYGKMSLGSFIRVEILPTT